MAQKWCLHHGMYEDGTASGCPKCMWSVMSSEVVLPNPTPLPEWLVKEWSKSLVCAEHRGQSRCDCDEEKK